MSTVLLARFRIGFGAVSYVLTESVTALSHCLAVAWLRQYAVSRTVAGYFPDEIIGFFSMDPILPVALRS
jgi:hypothetical protein